MDVRTRTWQTHLQAFCTFTHATLHVAVDVEDQTLTSPSKGHSSARRARA